MFCTKCGTQMEAGARYCRECGHAQTSANRRSCDNTRSFGHSVKQLPTVCRVRVAISLLIIIFFFFDWFSASGIYIFIRFGNVNSLFQMCLSLSGVEDYYAGFLRQSPFFISAVLSNVLYCIPILHIIYILQVYIKQTDAEQMGIAASRITLFCCGLFISIVFLYNSDTQVVVELFLGFAPFALGILSIMHLWARREFSDSVIKISDNE